LLSINSHPKSLWVLAFSNLWDTFSYYGIQTILALYLIHVFHLSVIESYTIYGGYAAFVFTIPIFGGFLADKYLGSRNAMIVGSLLSVLGNLLLAIVSQFWFFLGLAMTLLGTGLYKGVTTNLVGSLYNEKSQKESGYTWLYLSSNVGGTFAPLIFGLFVHELGWNYGFLFSATVVFVSLVWFLSNKAKIPYIKPLKQISNFMLVVICLGVVFLSLCLSFTFYYGMLIDPFIIVLLVLGLTYLINLAWNYKGQQKKQILALLTMNFFGMFYLVAGMQIGITIAVFIQQKIQSGEIRIDLPASVFGTFYALFVLLFAPPITWLWVKLKQQGIDVHAPNKLAIGVLLSAGGILIFALAALTHLLIACIILGIILLSTGELVLSPSMYAAISNNSPNEIKSTMIGSWFLFMAFGGYLSAIFAKAANYFSHNIIINSQLPNYFWQFLFLGTIIAIAGICLLLITKKLNKILI